MALELGESVLEDLLGVEDSNSTEGDDVVHMGDCLKSSLGDEFFHSKEEFGVSEYHVCKRLLYTTVGNSNERVIFLQAVQYFFL